MPSLWPQMMLVVSDVEASSRFYCDVIGLESALARGARSGV